MTATMTTGTSKAINEAMLCADVDQDSERMPPAATVTSSVATSINTMTEGDSANQPGGCIRAHAELGGKHQQHGQRQQSGSGEPQNSAVEAAAEVARHGEGPELDGRRREQHRHDDKAGEAADHQAQRIEADKKKAPVTAMQARRAHRGLRQHEPCVEGGNAAVRKRSRRAVRLVRRGADGHVERKRSEQHGEPQRRFGRNAEPLEDQG